MLGETKVNMETEDSEERRERREGREIQITFRGEEGDSESLKISRKIVSFLIMIVDYFSPIVFLFLARNSIRRKMILFEDGKVKVSY